MPSDVDECRRVPSPCAPGRCENTPGSFHCVCGQGYRAGPRAAECLGEKSAPPSFRPHPCPGRPPAVPSLPRFPKLLLPSPTPPPRSAPALPSAPPLPLPRPAGSSRRGGSLLYNRPAPLRDPVRLRSSPGPAPSMFRTGSRPPPGSAPVLHPPHPIY